MLCKEAYLLFDSISLGKWEWVCVVCKYCVRYLYMLFIASASCRYGKVVIYVDYLRVVFLNENPLRKTAYLCTLQKLQNLCW